MDDRTIPAPALPAYVEAAAVAPHLHLPTPAADSAVPAPIAHVGHTVAMLLIFLLIASLSRGRAAAYAGGSGQADGSHLFLYASSILYEWLLLGSVVAGVYARRDFFLRALRNRSRSNLASLGIGLAVFWLGYMAAIAGGVAIFVFTHKTPDGAVVLRMMPHTPSEFVAWFGVSLTAGITEELIFRGYLLQQLTAWTRRPVVSILIAALLFGSVHLYEGAAAILPLTLLAVVYGFVVRYFKGDLRAVIVAHTLQDSVVPFLLLFKIYLEQHGVKTR